VLGYVEHKDDVDPVRHCMVQEVRGIRQTEQTLKHGSVKENL